MATCKCSICGNEVSKSKSYSDGKGGRACRHHEGISEDAEKRKELDKKRILEENKNNPLKYNHDKLNFEKIEIIKRRCFVCGVRGISSKEFYFQKLVDFKKHEMIHGITNPFTDKEHPMNIKTKEPVIFSLIDQRAHEFCLKHKNKILRDFICLTEMEFVNICGDCCRTLDFDPVKFDVKALELGVRMGAVMKPFFEEIAIKQMTKDN